MPGLTYDAGVGAAVVDSGADGPPEPSAAELHLLVTRVVRARVGNHPAAEDLVQETVARVLAASDRIDGGIEAYAVTTARNVIATMWRDEARFQRYQPRMVDLDEPDAPDMGVLAGEDQVAVRRALESLSVQERSLLLAHEVDGTSLATLAAREGTTAGALGAQLRRLRARMRAEYLIVASHREPPTERCRPVLVAVALRDQRRWREAGVDDHLAGCDFCADVAGPLLESSQQDSGRVAIDVAKDHDVVEARVAVRRLAADLGFDRSDVTLVATVVSEIARNIVKFAERGRMTFEPARSRPGIRIVARDRGPGIEDVELAMRDGYTTYGGLGLGLPGARRIMDEFDIESVPGRGTTITMTRYRKDTR
ncbi:serine/threonine-protein kinase RsbT [Knoellia remsis]|uniref:Serine/threonine-protein kinase RsbT n=1 Tax=Knoellia remsis TaxID=407159 RepID=A0A2T0UXJ3_9MICO|nr:serine/threonine-protein kinase RsbT [Knoellia remsis]